MRRSPAVPFARSSSTAATKGPAPGSYLPAAWPVALGPRTLPAITAQCHVRTPDTESTPDPELFREVFGRFATGVAVITSAGPGGVGGMTANALCSLSLEPLLVLVCFENEARTLPIVREAGRFAVNVLSRSRRTLAGVFASKLPEAEKLDGVAPPLATTACRSSTARWPGRCVSCTN